MADERIPAKDEITLDDDELESLVAAEAGFDLEAAVLEFDEYGTLARVSAAVAEEAAAARFEPQRPAAVEPAGAPVLVRPCSLKTLNGSWLLEIAPAGPGIHLPQPTRGPMRIEASAQVLRVSGDVYVRRLQVGVPQPPEVESPIGPAGLVIGKRWYPAYPQSEYRWYFRSLGVTYSGGTLTFRFERHLWNVTTQEFTSQDIGSMTLSCAATPIKPPWAPQPTVRMTGSAKIGGKLYNVTATKTSPYYRGCLVEVDVMANRTWPATAKSCDGGQTFSFAGVYRASGMDFRATVHQIDVPDDPLLTTAELHQLLATHRMPAAGSEAWRLWLLVGSRMDGTLGIMFDTGNPPHREGSVGFYDPTLPNSPIVEASVRGKPLGEAPLAFLRTLIHEAGHAFNLFHPKHDVHSPPIGTTIMNQTGDVLGFATAANPYPCNATMGFNDHNRTSLIHSPDPQVKPAWKEFGWGHSATWAGIAEPVDALGLRTGLEIGAGVRLDLSLPAQARRGEFVLATATVTNTDDVPRRVTTALNLSEGDLWLVMTPPSGDTVEVRDVVVACGVRRFVELQPGESISGQLQLFYTSRGLTFDQPGTYTLRAELDVGDVPGNLLRSAPARLVIKPAVTESEQQLETLTMDPGVGLAVSLGDVGTDGAAQSKLTTVMDQFGGTDTGVASAMVIVNSMSRDLRDLRAGRVARSADSTLVNRALDVAVRARDAASVARLAAAIVSPIETAPPLLERVQTRFRRARRGTHSEEALAAANKVLEDHLA